MTLGLLCGMGEDSARFLLLAVVLWLYLISGAVLFHFLEADTEIREAAELDAILEEFQTHYFKFVGAEGRARLQRLLDAWANASSSGLVTSRRRWDYPGSFHFAATIVSTIGYGNSTPQTTAGKAAVIIYGFIGCSGGILFFNLFLERIITFLAWILRKIHLRRLKRRLRGTTLRQTRVRRGPSSLPDILDEEESTLDHWKPSVYWVMLYLTAASCVVASVAAAVYCNMEEWSYFESLYFCFVSFATIGFGDYVSTQNNSYVFEYAYCILNFLFLVVGCCCLYSLLNVTSIVIKQALNWVIVKITCNCFNDPSSTAGKLWRRQSFRRSSSRRRKRNSVRAKRTNISTIFGKTPDNNHNKTDSCDVDVESSSIGYDSDGEGRSGELISMRDFLKANKVSLAVMQKQLYEAAQMQRGVHHVQGFHSGLTTGTVGPLAIASEKLGDNKNVR